MQINEGHFKDFSLLFKPLLKILCLESKWLSLTWFGGSKFGDGVKNGFKLKELIPSKILMVNKDPFI